MRSFGGAARNDLLAAKPECGFQHGADRQPRTQELCVVCSIIELLVPELRKCGIFWSEYTVLGGTCRENFYGRKGQMRPLDKHVAHAYRWKAGIQKSAHKIPGA